MGNPANQREDDDEVSEEVRVSGVRLAVVVSPEEAAEHERLEPADRPKYSMLVVHLPETIDVLEAVKEIVTVQVSVNVAEPDEEEEPLLQPYVTEGDEDWAAARLAAKRMEGKYSVCVQCGNCGHTWDAEKSKGTVWAFEDDETLRCPNCGCAGMSERYRPPFRLQKLPQSSQVVRGGCGGNLRVPGGT